LYVSGIIYPLITHWAWSDVGWLKRLGYVDFSGCGPVHLLGGVCSFFGAVFLGPRLGRFESTKGDSEKEEIVGHSIPVRNLKNTSTWLQVGCILYFQQKMQ
jgi:Amt family ammonium transporter